MCYQHHSHSDSKRQLSKGYWEEINSTLAESRTGWQLEEVPSTDKWIKGMGQVASRLQPHLDPIHSVSKGRGRRTEEQVLQTALGASSASLFRSSASLVMWFAFVSFFTWKYSFKSFKRDECSGHDIIASVLLPPATWQLLTKWEIPGALVSLAGLFCSCLQAVSVNSRGRCQERGSSRRTWKKR